MAPILLRQPEPLELVIRKHPHVVATLVGHAHTACATTFAGRPLLVGGGCASTVPLDQEPYPVIWEAGPPTLAFHLLDDDGRLTTHWRALPFPDGAVMLLAFDTATPLVTVALHDGEDVVAELVSERPLQHGEQLAPLIDRALAEAGLVRQDLTAIGVGVGPGPFTGLRVGLVTARTLGSSWRSRSTASARSTSSPSRPSTPARSAPDFVVATDARRKEVYLAAYDDDGGAARRPVGRQAGRRRDRAAGRGRGRVLYPDAFPHAAGPTMPSAGWLAGDRRGAGRAARPRAALPPPARRRGARTPKRVS